MKAHLRIISRTLRSLPIRFRLWLLSHPKVFPWAMPAYTLTSLTEHDPQFIRHAQFSRWYPEDLHPRVDWHAAQGIFLRVLERAFFIQHDARSGAVSLQEEAQALMPRQRLLLYAPHAFAFHSKEAFGWVPDWRSLFALLAKANLRVVDFNPGFDRNGFFHVLAERPAATQQVGKPLLGAAHYFYLEAGEDQALGNSAAVLSVTGLRALRRVRAGAQEHSFYARVPEDVTLRSGDMAMGHYGLWVTGAREAGALTILYGPGDRFRPTRRDAPFYEAIQARGTFDAQYRAAHMVIMQAGGQWRMRDPFPYTGLCRWIDLPVSPAVFPRTKKRIATPGQRVFCFIGLYDNHQKGLDIARTLCRLCPNYSFIAIGCGPIEADNCREFPAVDNRRAHFRKLVTQADFLVSPARDDAQPGTVAECGSLGLLPIVTETTGYVLSFPRRMEADDLEGCATVLHEAQTASEEQVRGWQILNALYLEQFHRPFVCDAVLDSYLAEAIAEYSGISV